MLNSRERIVRVCSSWITYLAVWWCRAVLGRWSLQPPHWMAPWILYQNLPAGVSRKWSGFARCMFQNWFSPKGDKNQIAPTFGRHSGPDHLSLRFLNSINKRIYLSSPLMSFEDGAKIVHSPIYWTLQRSKIFHLEKVFYFQRLQQRQKFSGSWKFSLP